jgi:hypothetical protein
LSKEAYSRSRLSELDRSPIVLSRKRIEVTPSEEADVVGVFQLIEVGRVASKLLIEPSNGKRVLLSPTNKLVFFGSLQSDRSLRRRDSQADDQHG